MNFRAVGNRVAVQPAELALPMSWASASFAAGRSSGATRIVDDFSQLVTLETPADREVERSDDLRWIVLQSIH